MEALTHLNLRSPTVLVGIARATYASPRTERELETAVVAVPGVNRPVAA